MTRAVDLGTTTCERCGKVLHGWEYDGLRFTPGQVKYLHRTIRGRCRPGWLRRIKNRFGQADD